MACRCVDHFLLSHSRRPGAIIAAMKIASFETEHFFARYEFNTPYQLCNSDCESIPIAELLSLAGDSLDQFGHERLVYTESQGSFELRKSIVLSGLSKTFGLPGMLGSDDQHMRIGLGRDSFADVLARFEDWLKRDSAVS